MELQHSQLCSKWEMLGNKVTLAGWKVFVVDLPAAEHSDSEPLLVIHGFPTSSFDFRQVVDRLRYHRRVILFDMVGFGLSEKKDVPYTIALQADIVQALAVHLELTNIALLTHDMGDTVGGELLAREMQGDWDIQITRRVVTNGSIYIEMAHLTDGQNLLLSLADEMLPTSIDPTGAVLSNSLKATFSANARVAQEEIESSAALILSNGGDRLLPRTIRYIEERRRSQGRYTGAIETHPSPLSIVWGVEDPIAVVEMATRLHSARPDSQLCLIDGVGHYPMVESPEAFAAAALEGLGD
jgi:pimeloyl-ACP methyl ester carboxylesterase